MASDLPGSDQLGAESRSNLLSSAFHGTFAQEMWCAFCGEAIDEADENAGIAEDVRMGSMGDQWMAVTSGWGENDAKNVLVGVRKT